MKKLLRGLMGGSIVFLGLATWAGAASASPASNFPAQYVPPIFPAEGLTPDGALPASGQGVTVVGIGNCPTNLFGTPDGTNATDAVGFVFQSGKAVFYQMTTPGDPSTANGANIQGIATLIVGDNPDPMVSLYSGQTHLWFGTNSNANGQSYFGETISFHGVTPNGSHSITITANPGFNVSASGHQSGWGVLKITCS